MNSGIYTTNHTFSINSNNTDNNPAGAYMELESAMRRAGDIRHAEQIRQLREKLTTGRMCIAFCGHFSAGKSSLINRLCGAALLPHGPVPTSANLVFIGNGTSGATVLRRQTNGGESREEISLERLEESCKDGETIERVELRYPVDWLGGHCVLLDTPGIDSTDDAHRMSTESALHLADVVFYVMDYNHVQSETNFAFTSRLASWGKPFFLIVNQIDKHRESELPFAAFRSSVGDAFAEWGIVPDGVLYLSLREPANPHNEWQTLNRLLREWIGRREELLEYSVQQSAVNVTGQHADWMDAERQAKEQEDDPGEEASEDAREEAGEDAEEDAGAEVADSADERVGKMTIIERELAELEGVPERIRARLRKDIADIAENANLTPATTRDLAHDYLQCRKPGFKAGLFAGKQRTERYISDKLDAFYEDLQEQVQVRLEWHVKDLLKKTLETHGIHSPEWLERVERLSAGLTAAWLAERVSPQAGFTSEYTMTYTKLVAAELKEAFRRLSFELADAVAAACGEATEQAAAPLRARLARLQRNAAAQARRAERERAAAAYRAQLLAMAQAAGAERPQLSGDAGAAAAASAGATAAAAAPAVGTPVPSSATELVAEAPLAPAHAATTAPAQSSLASADHRSRRLRMASLLRNAADALAPHAALQTNTRTLRDKEARLRGQTFTIALFGAFSAGKSSLANALLGERILPVSPNPTTAAINKIMPPPEPAAHATADVAMKSPEQVLGDVRYSLQAFGLDAVDMTAALALIETLKPDRTTGKTKPHYSFLQAIKAGWEEARELLGRKLTVTMADYPEYAANERKSCFVDVIELYYRNLLTDQGIIFVDTPGADSIHARHTGVAFNYIKNADAILFVTYYNHAFSQADKEFLLQMGRVKDSFELDKMFFLVNAADLAENDEELAAVVEHVKANLFQHGIRHPRMYPVSSQQAVEAKLSRDSRMFVESGMAAFERDFLQFSMDELTDMSIISAKNELSRTGDMLSEWIQVAKSGEQERERKLAELDREVDASLKLVADTDSAAGKREIAKEIDELLYYVRQRGAYRFGEFFNLAFNPAVIRDDQARQTLTAAWNELQRLIAYDLSQEVLATSLRVERFIERLAERGFQQWGADVAKLIPTFHPAGWSGLTLSTPSVDDELSGKELDTRWLFGFYKGGRSFFEGDGKTRLRQAIEPIVAQMTTQYLAAHAELLKQSYSDQFAEALDRLKAFTCETIREHGHGMKSALSQLSDLTLLVQVKQSISALVKRAESES
jgi:GTPase Era involved in 16S rRNA processing